jgi:hypothetical protein
MSEPAMTPAVPSQAPPVDAIETDYRKRLAAAYVDDATWLELGKATLAGTGPALTAAGSALGTAAGWFWTLYSTAVIVGGAIVVPAGLEPSLLLAIPVVTILAAYLFALAAQMPTMLNVDLRSTVDIREGLARSVRAKVGWIRACTVSLVVSAILIATGLVLSVPTS